MDRNALHPDRIVRRLRTGSGRLLRTEICSDVSGIAGSLRFYAEQAEQSAQFWEDANAEFGDQRDMEHIVCHYRRVARRLRDTAEAIERDHAAGPWITLDQPFVHLGEARPAGEEVH